MSSSAPRWPRDRPVRMNAGGRLGCGLCAGRSRLIGGAGFWPYSIITRVVFTSFTAQIYFPDAERNTLTSWYIVDDDLLYRMSKNPAASSPVKQLMVPTALRLKVLTLGHEAAFAGHLGVKKTFDRIAANFLWPGILQLIQRFCVSCDICQRTVQKGSVSRAPLHSIPVVGIPFEKVAIDITGPTVLSLN